MLRRLFKLVIVVALIWGAGFVYFTTRIPDKVDDAARTTDGIVVLTGGADRLPEAVALLAEGRGSRLLISGVNQEIDDAKLRESLGMSDADALALFTCCIDTGRQALDTVGNADEIATWAAAHGFASLRVVTASYHMPRSLVEIRRRAPMLELVPHPVFPDHVKVSAWWRYPGTARVLASEYNKYVVSVLKLRVMDPMLGTL